LALLALLALATNVDKVEGCTNLRQSLAAFVLASLAFLALFGLFSQLWPC